MIDLRDVHEVIFYDEDGNKLFKFDKVKSLNIDMSASAREAMEFDCHITSYGFDIYEPHNITVPINEIDMNTAEGNKPVKTIFEDENKRNLNENVKSIFENLDQDKLDQEKKEYYDYYFNDADWREKNNPNKPIFTEKVNEFKELLGGDTEWLL